MYLYLRQNSQNDTNKEKQLYQFVRKAVALKALAGVALIGAAAALASNPVLLPIGIVAGRRKRSESFSGEEPEVQMDYIVDVLKGKLAKVPGKCKVTVALH